MLTEAVRNTQADADAAKQPPKAKKARD
jgi:hypothetical protein